MKYFLAFTLILSPCFAEESEGAPAIALTYDIYEIFSLYNHQYDENRRFIDFLLVAEGGDKVLDAWGNHDFSEEIFLSWLSLHNDEPPEEPEAFYDYCLKAAIQRGLPDPISFCRNMAPALLDQWNEIPSQEKTLVEFAETYFPDRVVQFQDTLDAFVVGDNEETYSEDCICRFVHSVSKNPAIHTITTVPDQVNDYHRKWLATYEADGAATKSNSNRRTRHRRTDKSLKNLVSYTEQHMMLVCVDKASNQCRVDCFAEMKGKVEWLASNFASAVAHGVFNYGTSVRSSIEARYQTPIGVDGFRKGITLARSTEKSWDLLSLGKAIGSSYKFVKSGSLDALNKAIKNWHGVVKVKSANGSTLEEVIASHESAQPLIMREGRPLVARLESISSTWHHGYGTFSEDTVERKSSYMMAFVLQNPSCCNDQMTVRPPSPVALWSYASLKNDEVTLQGLAHSYLTFNALFDIHELDVTQSGEGSFP